MTTETRKEPIIVEGRYVTEPKKGTPVYVPHPGRKPTPYNAADDQPFLALGRVYDSPRAFLFWEREQPNALQALRKWFAEQKFGCAPRDFIPWFGGLHLHVMGYVAWGTSYDDCIESIGLPVIRAAIGMYERVYEPSGCPSSNMGPLHRKYCKLCSPEE